MHLIWQEFFVAIKLRLYTRKENFKKIVSELDSDKYEVVTKFLFGLCCKHKFYELLNLVEIEGLKSDEDREECKQILKAIAIERLQQLLKNDAKGHKTSVLPVLGWVYEIKVEDLTHQASKFLREKIMISNQVFPSDTASFSYVLHCQKIELTIEVQQTNFIGKSFQHFIDALDATLIENKNIQVSHILLLIFASHNKNNKQFQKYF